MSFDTKGLKFEWRVIHVSKISERWPGMVSRNFNPSIQNAGVSQSLKSSRLAQFAERVLELLPTKATL